MTGKYFLLAFFSMTVHASNVPVAPDGSNCALGPHAPFRKLVNRAAQLPDSFLTLVTRPKPVIDPAKLPKSEKDRDTYFNNIYYKGGGPTSLIPASEHANALPIFDSIDVIHAAHLLGLPADMKPADFGLFSDLMRRRAHGQYDWRAWDLNKLDPTGSLAEYGLDTAKMDAALVVATSLEYRPGVRIVPITKEGDTHHIPPGNVPSGPMLFMQGNTPVTAKTTELVNVAVQRLFTPMPGEKTGRGIMFLSDVHAGRISGEEARFLQMADMLANYPPKKIVFGGDLLDASAMKFTLVPAMNEVIQGKEGKALNENDRSILATILAKRAAGNKEPMTYQEMIEFRAMKFKYLLGYLSAKVPHTEIIIQFGNHDLPRLSELPRRESVKEGQIFGDPILASEVPEIKLDQNGMLPPGWEREFKARLKEVMVRKGARRVISSQIDRATPEEMVALARQFYQLKGLNKDPLELSKFNYYDEKAADYIRRELSDNKQLSFLGRRSDKYFRINVGTAEAPVWILVTHEPQDQGPNMNRIDPPKPSVFGGQTSWEPDTRAVVNFDRHSAGTVASQAEVKDGTGIPYAETTADGTTYVPKAFHVIGSFTGNSNSGQNMMAAIMETDADFGIGNLYHVTFAGEGGNKVTAPIKAQYRQVQYAAPHLRPDAPSALSSTTVGPAIMTGGFNNIFNNARRSEGAKGAETNKQAP